MNNKNTVIISFALLGIFLFAGSASAAVDFPASEAGISAYVKAKASIDLNLAKSAFASIERETADYVIGTVVLSQHTEEQYPHVYVSKDGWIVAYYLKDREASWILSWADYSEGEITSIYLSKAAGIVATSAGGTTSGLKYYDFRYPDATKIMIIIESVRGEDNFFKVTIPLNFAAYAVEWSHYNIDHGHDSYDHSYAYLNGVLKSTINGATRANYGSFTGQFENGVEQEFKVSAASEATGRIGLVLEYAE